MTEIKVSTADTKNILVWDFPVRIFHWLLVMSFAGAWLTAESERWRQVHVTLGYTMAGLVVFRIIWGIVGSRYARFSSFVRGPSATYQYLKSLVGTRPEHHVGHNPAGAVAIVGLLALILITAFSGWATFNDLGGRWLEETHEVAANTLLGLVLIHLLGVAFGCFLHRENLVRSMLTGRKQVSKDLADSNAGVRPWSILGALVFVGVLSFWIWQWQQPAEPANAFTTNEVRKHRDREDD
jgi:cytochrome b